MRLLFLTAKIQLFPQTPHKHITEIFTIFTESAARLRAVRRNQLIPCPPLYELSFGVETMCRKRDNEQIHHIFVISQSDVQELKNYV